MISARLRYTALSLLALAALVTGLAQLLDHAWPGAVLGLALTAELLLGCRRIRRTAEHHQDEQRRELEALRAEPRAVPAEHCGAQPPEVFTWLHPGQYSECVLRPGHLGSHADEHGTRWWWIDTELPPRARAQQR
ncbi:hypothetical protein [Streptomyces sp. NBC_01237]|uniref:hypothetical protein n=1 Tax=Streptomyces sp. NBC_01237 TaxID=2903790 RepID=UPI002DD801CC|nr:hypothetical protein [Streptomyces sp. NBC_01237]WRZ72859.1 hypothetical protein OG251_15175 [Streptomyces sp. NBC_01237]